MKKKSFIALGVSVVMLVAVFAGCGKKDEGNNLPPTPTEAGAVTPEPGKAPSEVLSEIHGKVKEAYGENYIPSMPYDETVYKEVMQIDPSLYDAAVGEGPMMSAHVEAFVGFHATAGNAEALKTALEAYQQGLKDDTLQYPMNVPVIQASVVEAVGDYVFFYMLGGVDTAMYDTDEEAVQACVEANKKASGVIQEVLGK